MDNQQIVVTVDQRNGAVTSEVNVGFINDNDGIRIGLDDLLNGSKPEQATGWGVRVGENDAAKTR